MIRTTEQGAYKDLVRSQLKNLIAEVSCSYPNLFILTGVDTILWLAVTDKVS